METPRSCLDIMLRVVVDIALFSLVEEVGREELLVSCFSKHVSGVGHCDDVLDFPLSQSSFDLILSVSDKHSVLRSLV